MLGIGLGITSVSRSDAIASGDFTNIATNNAADGVYTLNGETVALGDIVDLAHQYTTFNPATDLDAGGLKVREEGGFPANTGLMIKEPLRSQLLGGFTVVFETYMTDTSAIFVDMFDDEFEFNLTAAIQNYVGRFQRADYSTVPVDENNSFPVNTEINNLAVNKIAFTVAPDRMAVSINGDPIHVGFDANVLTGTLENVQITYYDAYEDEEEEFDFRLRSFAFYESVDDAALPALSALA